MEDLSSFPLVILVSNILSVVTASLINSAVPIALAAIFAFVIAPSATSTPILLNKELSGSPVITRVFVGDESVPVPVI